MVALKKTSIFISIITTLFILNTVLLISGIENIHQEPIMEDQRAKLDETTDSFLIPNEGQYRADVTTVKTIIELDTKGKGVVSVFVNCTPDSDHVGMYLKTLEQNEPIEVISSECYAINDGQTLDVNYTALFDSGVSYRIDIEDISLVNLSKTILYKFTYTADFFLSNQISLYSVDPTLTVIDINRPIWDGDLEYQELKIVLPIDVGQSSVPSDFLQASRFSVEDFMVEFYNLTNTTTESSGSHLFTFICSKDDMAASAPFQARFYLADGYFSLPKAFNWAVILLASIFTLIALALFIVVVHVKNESEEEVQNFKNDLYDVLREKEDTSEK